MFAAASAPRAVAVSLRGVRRVFRSARGGEVVAVEGVDLEVQAGDFVAVLGPSGCGKSTLLRIIAGLDRPDSGAVAVTDGRSLAVHARRVETASEARIGYVFQDAHLLPWRTVLDNVALPLELLGVGRAPARIAAAEVIAQVGLADAAGRYPAELSGGMRMRVSLARALVAEPALLLLDEPFAALDEITRQELDEQLRDLWKSRGITVLFVTHSIMEAAFLARRAVVLSARPASVVLDVPLDLPVERTVELRTDAHFAGQMRILQQALRQTEVRRPGHDVR